MERNNLEKFLAKARSGVPAKGIVITSNDLAVPELAADCGCDFVWVDMEHSPLTITDAAGIVGVLRGSNCAPIIRVAETAGFLTKAVLDLAPAGVIFPMINTPEAAAAAVDLCRYPIHGGSRGAALRSNNCYGRVPLDSYLEQSRRDPLVIVQIEHREAVENIEEIVKVPGVGSICIGPFDLSFSYGKPGEFQDPEISGAIDRVLAAAENAGVLTGGFCGSEYLRARRMNWQAVGDDAALLAAAIRSKLADK